MAKTNTPEKILRAWAKQKGWSASDLAQASGLSYQHAWNLLRGRSRVTYETLGRLLVALNSEGPALAIAEAMKTERGGRASAAT